jgi:hypothetical protein
MNTNRWTEISGRVYARLLKLYPKKHYTEYGVDMLQVFKDQCRSVNSERKGPGFLALWVRTLIDLGINVFREHLTAPHSSLGLLEAVPGAPLPWKGVALVLIPGLIFFASQVAQLSGEDWFFLMIYRGAYFMIIPVLAVWVWKRKFPIWGLIPLGLLFKTLWAFGYRLQLIAQAAPFTYISNTISNPISRLLVKVTRVFPSSTLKITIVIALLLIMLALLWSTKRRAGIPAIAWVWLGSFFLLVVFDILGNSQFFIKRNVVYGNIAGLDVGYLLNLAYYYFYLYSGLLVLILLGAWLARRHGRLALLLPLGYLLPTVIYGRISNEWPDPTTPQFAFMFAVSATALVYRFLVALAAPLWIVRSATGLMQKRASATSLTILIAIQVVFNLVIIFYYGWRGALSTAYLAISEQLIVGAGIALALTLYRAAPATQTSQEGTGTLLDSTSVS